MSTLYRSVIESKKKKQPTARKMAEGKARSSLESIRAVVCHGGVKRRRRRSTEDQVAGENPVFHALSN